MKIVTLLGSARKNGNTATILKWVEEELSSMGHEVEHVYLNSKNIKGCLACAKCKAFTDKIGCVIEDDAPGTLGKMIDADVTLFTSPVYFWGFSAQMKLLIDRSYSLVTDYHKPTHTSLLENQRQGLLVTGGGEYEKNCELLYTAFDKLTGFYKSTKSGELFVGKCTIAEELTPEIREQAVSFARKLVE